MKISIHSLYWDNGARIKEINKKVTDHFGLGVHYHNLNGIPHGLWMNAVLDQVDSDVFGFFDADCVPTNLDIVQKSIEYVSKFDTFVGIAQCSNHIPPYSHIFAAPAFFFITKSCYEKMNKPTFSENARSDVAEEVSYRAEEMGIKYRAIYPTHYEKPSTEGVWSLGNYGGFAVGTHFTGGIYHLYQGRFENNIKMFEDRCNEIVSGTFSTENMISCLEF